MNTGSFYQFHNTRNKYICTVTDSINFNFFTNDIFIYKYRLVFVDFNRGFQIHTKLLFICNNLHSSSAKNEAGANKYRIAYFCSGFDTVFYFGNSFAFGLRNVELFKNFFKAVSVFGSFNRFAICTDNLNTTIHERLCKVDCRLATKRCYYTNRLFKFDDIHNILGCERFEIKLIGCSIIS